VSYDMPPEGWEPPCCPTCGDEVAEDGSDTTSWGICFACEREGMLPTQLPPDLCSGCARPLADSGRELYLCRRCIDRSKKLRMGPEGRAVVEYEILWAPGRESRLLMLGITGRPGV
jgi:hypothetical protein